MVGNDHLDLPVGCTVQIDRTNPLFNDSGSMSLALTVPATPHNERLLGYPSRLDVAVRHDVYDGSLADGLVMWNVKVNVISAGPDGIEINLGIDESCLYEQWSDVKLRDIPDLPVYEPDGGVTYLVQLMQQVYTQAVDLDYHVFPVAVEWADDEKGVRGTLLNAVHAVTGGYALDSERRILPVGVESDDTVTVPVGYGITPFLRVGRFLHILLDAYGYTLADNLFDTDPQLSHLVLLNNTADTICAGYIDYRDLLPDCTVNEFLDSLKVHFGAFLLADSGSHTARIVFIRDIMSDGTVADWTGLHADRPRVTINEPRALVLSCATGYALTETECDDMDTFLGKYADFIDTNAGGSTIKGVAPMCHDAFTQAIYTQVDGGQQRRYSSLCWPWQKPDKNIADEPLSSTDKFVALYASSDGDVNRRALPLYLSGVRNGHTVVKTSSSVSSDETAEQPTDLALCFAAGSLKGTTGFNFGTPYCYQPDGTRIKDASLNVWQYSLLLVGADGAYSRWWSAYDHMLRYGNRQVEVDLRMGISDLQELATEKPVSLFGQPMLIDSISHPLPVAGSAVTRATLRTMKPLSPAVPVVVSDIVKPTTYWQLTSDINDVKSALLASIESQLDQAHDRYEIVKVTYTALAHPVYDDTRVPTAAQVANNTSFETTYGLTVSVYYRYKDTGFLHWESGTQTRAATGDVTEIRTAKAY